MTNQISENIWNAFQVVSKTGSEVNALLDLIDEKLEGICLTEENKKFQMKGIKYLNNYDSNDSSGWLYMNETRTHAVIPRRNTRSKFLIGIQVVLFDEEGSLLNAQAMLSICLRYDRSEEAFDAENWFSKKKENVWDSYTVESEGYTVCALQNKEFNEEGDEIIFSVPLGALGCPHDVDTKVIQPIVSLLEHLDPNNKEVIKVFNDAKDIIKLSDINFPQDKK